MSVELSVSTPSSTCPALAPGATAAGLRRRGIPWVSLLESGLDQDGLGRASFLCARPLAVAVAEAGQELRLVEGPAWLPEHWPGDPLEAAADLIQRLRPKGWRPEPGLAFSGGGVLTLSYDLGRRYERLPESSRADTLAPDLSVAIYGRIATFDTSGAIRVVGAGPGLTYEDLRGIEAQERSRLETPPPQSPASWPSTFTAQGYRAAVDEIRRLIRRGDMFEVNLSRRYTVDGVDAERAYAALRAIAPAPFMADLDLPPHGDTPRRLLSASPERFLRLTADGLAESWPIKGTRPRGRDAAEDARLLRELLDSPKEAAELAMIVDLVRSDLGRVAIPGSVRVIDPRRVQSWPTVHHTVGVVEARLDEGKSWADLVRATFPPGSVTGAPKIRAMEVIEALEPTRRGLYCGAFGYVGFDGALDLAVAIRIVALEGQRAHVHAGGAILLGSDPAAEELETLTKARALITAVAHARGPRRG